MARPGDICSWFKFAADFSAGPARPIRPSARHAFGHGFELADGLLAEQHRDKRRG